MSELRAACHGRDVERDGWPTVSVVMPIRNEADHLGRAVESVLSQGYPLDFDVCLAVAPSDDGTETIAASIAEREPRVSVVANPTGVTPAGLNAAIGATTGDVVVRVDGHAALSDGYIRRAVDTMRRTGAVNVGGMQVPAPETPFEQAVAAATTSWLGTGGATYRVGGRAGPVDTVYLGVFDRAAGDAVGWFDETLIRNQDYELNIRLRDAGGVVWFDPELSVSYRPRGSFRDLAKQYYEYGRWKAEVVRRRPDTLRRRQTIPAVVTATLGLSIAGSIRRPSLLAIPAAYLAVVGAATTRLGPKAGPALVGMHIGWGCGFLSGLARAVAGPHRSDGSRPPARTVDG
ncbi:MAG: glycosyltransferase family 2 protein [Ilumatobacter sp.]|uniref:glycosyltransferase family 2 protein n=1 Tax=Ilumatobacter sp. TaxID=1967498 RepID=UPI00262439A5|nr:glycosyltransferase family 2 protein [Ilumatobacter sp.]MDJ0768346.1 glycosyltransferase family 2 protein [Ilumatobacter sp.]